MTVCWKCLCSSHLDLVENEYLELKLVCMDALCMFFFVLVREAKSIRRFRSNIACYVDRCSSVIFVTC